MVGDPRSITASPFECGRLPGFLGDQVEAQNHLLAGRHGVDQAVGQRRKAVVLAIGQHGELVGEQDADGNDAAVDRGLDARIGLEALGRHTVGAERPVVRQVELELQDGGIARRLAHQHHGVDIEVGTGWLGHRIARYRHALLGLPGRDSIRAEQEGNGQHQCDSDVSDHMRLRHIKARSVVALPG